MHLLGVMKEKFSDTTKKIHTQVLTAKEDYADRQLNLLITYYNAELSCSKDMVHRIIKDTNEHADQVYGNCFTVNLQENFPLRSPMPALTDFAKYDHNFNQYDHRL